MFGFRNPGGMRVPVELAIWGGESDGRNRTLQQMFLMIGAGERAGSGVPKIHKGWREQHWRPPALYELQHPSEQTLLTLLMEDLLPEGIVDTLHKQFGRDFDALLSDERIVLATAALETTVSHARAMTLCEMHPVDMTKLLQSLVQANFLEKVGQGRGTRYHLPGTNLPDPDQAFLTSQVVSSQKAVATQPSNLEDEPSELLAEPSELRSEGSKVRRFEGSKVLMGGARGRSVTSLDMVLIDNLTELDEAFAKELQEAALPAPAVPGRVPKEQMEAVILTLCQGRYVTLRVLANLLRANSVQSGS